MLNRDERGQTGDRDSGLVPAHRDVVVPVGAADRDAVGRAVGDGSAEGACEVDVDGLDAGTAQVVDRDGVGAAEGVEVDGLETGRVHRDIPEITHELEPVATCRQLDFLGRAGSVEDHRVVAGAAVERVAAVARIPDERVVAWAEIGLVVAAVAVDRVVAGAAEQRLGSLAAGNRVVTGPAVDPRRDAVGEGAVGVVDPHVIVAGAGVDRDPGNLRAREAEVGCPVVAEVDLKDGRVSGLEPQRDRVGTRGAVDVQLAVPEIRLAVRIPGRSGRPGRTERSGRSGRAERRAGRDAGSCAGCGEHRHGRRNGEKSRTPGDRCSQSSEVLHVYISFSREPRAARGLAVSSNLEPGDGRSHRGDPPVFQQTTARLKGRRGRCSSRRRSRRSPGSRWCGSYRGGSPRTRSPSR